MHIELGPNKVLSGLAKQNRVQGEFASLDNIDTFKELLSHSITIGKYISEFNNPMVYQADGSLKPALNPIRIIDVLRHTSGIGKTYPYLRNRHDYLKENRSLDLKTEVERLARIPLATQPGTSWIYGPSVSLGAYMVEKLTGKKIEDYLKTELFDPLEMEDTFFEIPKEKLDRFTPLYFSDKNEPKKLVMNIGLEPAPSTIPTHISF